MTDVRIDRDPIKLRVCNPQPKFAPGFPYTSLLLNARSYQTHIEAAIVNRASADATEFDF